MSEALKALQAHVESELAATAAKLETIKAVLVTDVESEVRRLAAGAYTCLEHYHDVLLQLKAKL